MVNKIFRFSFTLLLSFLLLNSRALPVQAQEGDPLDPFDALIVDDSRDDKEKSAQELIDEGTALMSSERLLDARTKLLRALNKDPKAYEAHIMLAGYYLVHVGHFRLALKYIKQAEALFAEKNGRPPYSDPFVRNTHARILHLLSQIRLDLDNYQGSLDVLDEFTSYGYYSTWYPGARAWVLMKLGRIKDAIQVARLGLAFDGERGRTLNMLGILLSMDDERQASLQVFKDAISYEFSLGESGQPATPLNNSGEVLKEIFEEDRAEASWLRATSLPDGCEHVLPSLNLALLYIDQLNWNGAKRAMDNFESCVAQFPLRNGEEHRALVALARGRIALHTGKVGDAIKLLSESLEKRQWFGKIGTSSEDLESAASISLSQAYDRAANIEGFKHFASWTERLKSWKFQAEAAFQSWWFKRRAAQVLTENLADFEDLYVRNTDALIEYPTLGELTSYLSRSVLQRKIEELRRLDKREPAGTFYRAYLAESELQNGNTEQAITELEQTIRDTRPRFDDLLRVHLLLRLLGTQIPNTKSYATIAEQISRASRPALRNYGLRLPVNYILDDPETIAALNSGPFILDNSMPLGNRIEGLRANETYRLEFFPMDASGSIKVSGSSLEETVNRFGDEVFSVEVK